MNLMQFDLLFGMQRGGENLWDCIREVEFSKSCWNFVMEKWNHSSEPMLAIYGYGTTRIYLFNLTKSGFEIGTREDISIARIYGVNY